MSNERIWTVQIVILFFFNWPTNRPMKANEPAGLQICQFPVHCTLPLTTEIVIRINLPPPPVFGLFVVVCVWPLKFVTCRLALHCFPPALFSNLAQAKHIDQNRFHPDPYVLVYVCVCLWV